jgi:hypothetical protein
MPGKAICIFHDIERGHGHRDLDPAFAARADALAGPALSRMLEIESRLGIRTSYNVLGSLFDEVAAEISTGGHAIGFHSFDHNVENSAANSRYQVSQCRAKDKSIRGYRPPQSRITADLDAILGSYGFDWLASSARSLNSRVPERHSGLARIPIAADDYDLYRKGEHFKTWQRRILDAIDERDFTAIGLHDCYAEFWLESYEAFLDTIASKGTLNTFDEVAASV